MADKKTILLVEDDPLTASLEKRQLEMGGYRILHAASGEAAVALIQEGDGTVDLILMDIDLGKGIDGTDAARRILEFRETPILFLSSHTEKEIVEKTEEITSYGYVVKSSSFTVLDASIKMAFKLFEAQLNIQRHRRDLEAANEALRLTQASVDRAADAIMWIGGNGDFKFVNESLCALLGFSRDELLQKSIFEISPTFTRHDFDSEWNEKKTVHVETTFFSKTGLRIPVAVTACHLAFEGKALLCVYARDITERKRSEDALRTSEDHNVKLISNMMDGFYRSTAEGKFLKVNQAMVNILGYDSIEELLGVDIVQDLYFDPGDRRISLLGQNGVAEESYRLKRKDGSELWVEASDCIVQDRNGRELYREGFLRDVTKRKLAEKELQVKEERYRLLTENSSDVIWVFNLAKNCYIYISPAIFQLRGLSIEEALRETLGESLSPRSLELVNEMIASTFPAFMSNPDYPFYRVAEVQQPHRNGGLVWVEISVRYRMNADGEAEIIGVSHDITDRKETEAALRESEERFKALHNASFGGIIIHDGGLILECNQGLAEMTGYALSELIGMDGLRLIAEKSRASVLDAIRAGYEKPYEAYGVRKNGEEYPIRLEARNIPYKGRTARTVEFRDITESKVAYEKVTELLAEKELILKEVHHRIKNNMNTMASLLRLQSDEMRNQDSKLILQDAAARIKSMMVLYDRLYLSASYSKVSLRDYLPKLISEIMGIFPDSGSVRSALSAEEILVDAKLLSTLGIIINELVTNSMKYAFQASKDALITVSAFRLGTAVCLEYGDNGIGIPESVSFENPVGFGMQLVQMLIEQVSGSVRLERQNGTKYVFEFEAG